MSQAGALKAEPAATVAVDAAEAGCFHCGLPLPAKDRFSAEIDGDTREFCCIGCRAVCEAIYEAGLDGFYDRTPEGTLRAPPPEPPKELGLYDLDEVQEEFVDALAQERTIHLLVEGIHCAACVWLIEKTLNRLPGVVEASVNLSARRVRVKWDNDRIQLSAIVARLADIGYSAVPYDPATAEGRLKQQDRAFLYRVAFAGFAAMNVMWTSIALYTGAADDEFRQLFHWVGFALATPTLLYSGYPFYRGAITGLRNLHFTMDLPIAIGVSVTYLYSLYITLSGSTVGEVYYDTVVNFLFIILVGRYIQSLSKRQAVTSTQRLIDLQPLGATVIREGKEQTVPIRAVKEGETVLVRPGDKVSVDGVVLEGSSSLDEALLTGESRPVPKGRGDTVSAGTINLQSALTIQVTGTLRNTALGRIIALVEDAQSSKAPIQCTADRIVPWFVAVTLTLATLTFFWWLPSDFEIALLAATAVLIITCPCAFGMSTPMAIAVASGLGARQGILVKRSEVLETLSTVNHVVFDKTGTLTEGRMRVTDVLTTDGFDRDRILRAAASLERFSEHSIATAIREQAESEGLRPDDEELNGFDNVPGFGIRGLVSGETVVVGTAAWLRRNAIEPASELAGAIEKLEAQAITCVHVAVGGRYAGIIGIADQLRADAVEVIGQLRQAGIKLTLLSGDRRAVAEAVAARLGGMEVIAEVLPEDKDSVIARLQKQGDRVAMVGDGVNDAPALTRADVGIAIGSGTDVSVECADIVLMNEQLDKVIQAIRLSRRTLRTIRQNIGISFTYNAIMVPLAMAAYVTPLVAAITMPLSSLAVIGNAARIRTLFRKKRSAL